MKNEEKLPGLEIFFSSKVTLKDAPEEEDAEAAKIEAEDWADFLGLKAMRLFDQDGNVLVLEDEEKTGEEIAAMITPADGITSNWIFYDFNYVVPNVEQFPTYPFYPINEMNSNFGYIDVSSGIKKSTANNSPDNEHDFNKKDENKIEPIENEIVLINLGTFENPKEIKIGSSLSQKEKLDLS